MMIDIMNKCNISRKTKQAFVVFYEGQFIKYNDCEADRIIVR